MPEYVIHFKSGNKAFIVADSPEHARQKARDRIARIAASGGSHHTDATKRYLSAMEIKDVKTATNRDR